MPLPSMPYEDMRDQYGLSDPNLRLPPPGYSPTTDRALDLIAQGVSPYLIRELDAWTGAVHGEYAVPGGPSGNRNIWVLGADGQWLWFDEEGAPHPSSDVPAWVAPPPSVTPEGAIVTERREPIAGPAPAPTTPGTPSVTVPPQSVPRPPSQGTGLLPIADQVRAMARQAGSDRWGYDQWGYFYQRVTGQSAPAPEDRGLRREADGAVKIDGTATYSYDVWARYALETPVPAPLLAQTSPPPTQTPEPAVPPPPGSGPGARTTLSPAERDIRIKALATEHGSDKWGWDQWGWFYKQVTGEDGPSPEEKGLTRDASGGVFTGGAATYSYEDWARYALAAAPPPPPSAAPNLATWALGAGAAYLGFRLLRGRG